MKPISLTLVVPLVLAGCARQKQPNVKVSKKVTLVVVGVKASQLQSYSGNYYRGDGLGYNVSINLKKDGTYSAEWSGCGGVYGTAKGTWGAKGQQIVLKPIEEKDMMKGHLRTLDIIYQQKKISLSPTTDRKERTKQGMPTFLYFQKRK